MDQDESETNIADYNPKSNLCLNLGFWGNPIGVKDTQSMTAFSYKQL